MKLIYTKPIKVRRNIPFYHDKTEAEFKKDKYENYAEVVTRQTRLHLAADAWKNYGFQPVLDWVFQAIKTTASPLAIVEIGCGVGRLIGELANHFPAAECCGIDYSYQLLRQAHDYWIIGRTIDLNDSNRGFLPEKIIGKFLPNIHFALAKGEALPFANNSLDLICSSFTLDRFFYPDIALEEMFRVMKKEGKVLIVSPLNFEEAAHWSQFFPKEKLLQAIKKVGFSVEKIASDIVVKEELDVHGNAIYWQCLGLCLKVV